MNLLEFKAWFEGFVENMDGTPSKKQWERIQKRVKEISGEATTVPVFIDRYVNPYRSWWSGTRPYEITSSAVDFSEAGRAEMKALISDSA